MLTEVINRKVISELKPRNNLKPNQKPVYILRLNKIQDIYHLIRVLKSFLVLKKERGEIMFEYIRSRLTKSGTFYRVKKRFSTLPYSEKELFLISELKRLNARGNLNSQ